MDVQAVAGPSSRPYGPTAYEGAGAEPSRLPNGMGSTTNGTSRLQNGLHDATTTDNAANNELARIKKTSATFHTSDSIVSKAIHKKPRTGYCYSTKMQMHKVVDPSDDEIHPETPERIAFIFKKLQETGTLARMDRIAIREAVKAEASLVHAEELWDTINSFSLQPHEFFLLNQQYFHKLSLYVNEHTAMCARLSLGGVIETCRAVAEERVSNAFAIVRPPGHHAEPEQSMGFCFYNNVAVAAAYIKTVYKNKGIRKILILDWDVHHGNGTQKAFWDDPDILYMSIHRHEGGTFYPGTDYGGADMIGGPNAKGGCVNVPWDQAGATDADYLYAFQKIIMPIAYEFAPDFVIVSAGFDAAEGDQLGGCHVSPAGYGHMTHMLSSLANGRLVVALEGGYNIDAIAASALECVKVLLGEIPPQMPSMRASEHATEAIHEVQLIQSRYWNSIQPTSMSKEEMQDAGPVVPVTEILKAHRTHHLWDKYKLYNVPISVPALEEAFKDQLLITDNVFKAKTIVLYVHDMGNLRAELSATSADIVAENSFLIDTSSRIVEWTTDPLRDWALIDVNILAHSGSKNMITREAMLKKERALVLHVWDHIVHLSTAAQNVVLIGQAAGCHAIINLLNERSVSCMDRVRAAVQIFDMQKPPIIADNDRIPGLRAWFHDLSMAIFPADHAVLADESRVGKRYGKVFKSKDPRTSHVLSEWLTDIQRFLVERLNERLIPIPAGTLTETDEDVTLL